jgi:hypothetical protein
MNRLTHTMGLPTLVIGTSILRGCWLFQLFARVADDELAMRFGSGERNGDRARNVKRSPSCKTRVPSGEKKHGGRLDAISYQRFDAFFGTDVDVDPDFLVIFSRELVKRDGRNNRTLQFPTFAQIHEQARHLQRSNRDTGAIGRTSGILLRMRRNRRPSDARKGVEFEPEPH